jgi:uncharacterized membrane protein YoaK (UPF0700 family)
MARATAGVLAGFTIAGDIAYIALLASNPQSAMLGAGLFFIATGLAIYAWAEDDPVSGVLAGISVIGIVVSLWKIPYTVDILVSGFLGSLSMVFLLTAAEKYISFKSTQGPPQIPR